MEKAFNYIERSMELNESVSHLIEEHFGITSKRGMISNNIYEWGIEQLRKKQLGDLRDRGVDSFDALREIDFERYCRLNFLQTESGYNLAKLYILGDFIPNHLRGIVDNPDNNFKRNGSI